MVSLDCAPFPPANALDERVHSLELRWDSSHQSGAVMVRLARLEAVILGSAVVAVGALRVRLHALDAELHRCADLIESLEAHMIYEEVKCGLQQRLQQLEAHILGSDAVVNATSGLQARLHTLQAELSAV